jgi:hypothetical protein
MLKVHHLWDVVDGTSKRPSANATRHTPAKQLSASTAGESSGATDDPKETGDTAEILEWDEKDNLAVVFLQANIEFDVLVTLTPAENAHHLWAQLEDRFDRKTVSSLHSLLRNVVTLQYKPDKSMKHHLAEFNTLWSALLTRTANARNAEIDPFAYYLHQLASVSQLKAGFLLLSLQHESLDSVVDNLQTKPNATFDDVYEKLLDLDARRTSHGNAGEAYNSQGSRKQGKRKAQNSNHKKGNKNELVCTWCEKNGEKYTTGHVHKECRKAKAFRDKEKSNASGHVASVSGSAFHSHANTSAIPSNSAWIFDPGATNHMTGTLVENPTPYSGSITVGGGRRLQITPRRFTRPHYAPGRFSSPGIGRYQSHVLGMYCQTWIHHYGDGKWLHHLQEGQP